MIFEILACLPACCALLYFFHFVQYDRWQWLGAFLMVPLLMLPEIIGSLLLWLTPYSSATLNIVRASVWGGASILHTYSLYMVLHSSAESGGQAVAMFFSPGVLFGVVMLVVEIVLLCLA